MELGLSGRVAVIVGGSTGIGRATALRFAAEGTKLAVCARRPEVLARLAAEIAGSGAELMTVAVDVSRAGEVEQFIAATAQRFGRIDISSTMPAAPRRARSPRQMTPSGNTTWK